MVDFHHLAHRHIFLSRRTLPAHMRHLPQPPSPLHQSLHPGTPNPVISSTRPTNRPSNFSTAPQVDTTSFPTPFRHHYISFHTPASHMEMICPWVVGVRTWEVRGPTRGGWGCRAKIWYLQFEVRGMEEYWQMGDDGWETEDEELADGENGTVAREADLLLEVALGGQGGGGVVDSALEPGELRGGDIMMPDFEPFVELAVDANVGGEDKDMVAGCEDGEGDHESSVFI